MQMEMVLVYRGGDDYRLPEAVIPPTAFVLVTIGNTNLKTWNVSFLVLDGSNQIALLHIARLQANSFGASPYFLHLHNKFNSNKML